MIHSLDLRIEISTLQGVSSTRSPIRSLHSFNMVLYELVCITRGALPDATMREIARTAGTQVINHGGVVRGIQDWGTRMLPSPIKKYQQTHQDGRYFLMWFDTNPRVQRDIGLTMKLDPRILRHTFIKLADSIDKLHQPIRGLKQ